MTGAVTLGTVLGSEIDCETASLMLCTRNLLVVSAYFRKRPAGVDPGMFLSSLSKLLIWSLKISL